MSESIQYYLIEWRQRQLIEWVHGFGGPVTLPHKWSGLPSLSVTTLMTQLLYLEQVNMYLNIWEPFTHTFVNIGTRCTGTPTGRVGICLNPDLSEIARVGGSRPYDSDPTGVGIWGIGS